MGFFDEIYKLFSDEKVDNSYKIVILGSSGVVIEGYKTITKMQQDEIIVEIKNNKSVCMQGVKLYIKKLEKNELIIAGEILDIKIL